MTRLVRPPGRRIGRVASLVLIALVLALGTATPARAHAVLVRADPAPDSVVGAPPALVRIWLSEPIAAAPDAVIVTGPDGTRVDRGDARVAPDDATQLQVSLGSGASGTYTVQWRAISADTHPVSGTFYFSVGAPSAGGPPPPVAPSATSGTAWQSVARWLHLVGLVLALGPLVFGLAALERPRDPAIELRLWRLSRAGALLVVVAAPLLLLAQAVGVGGSLSAALSRDVLRSLLLDGYGARWVGRLALAALLLVVAWTAVRRGSEKRLGHSWAVTALALGAALLLLTSLNGHPASTQPVWLSVLVDWIHLAATVAWLGGLAALAVAVRPELRGRSEATRLALLAPAVSRFSVLALVSVEALILTGLYATWAHVPRPAALVDSGYGVALLTKLGLVLVTLGLAAVNLLVLRPRLRAAARHAPDAPADAAALVRRVMRTVGAEALLGVAILAAVGVLTSLPPPPPPIASTPASVAPALTLAQNAGPTLVTLALDPAVPGANQVVVSLQDAVGAPVVDARVRIRTRPGSGQGPSAATQMEAADGRYRATVLLAPPGTWHLEVLVTLPGQPEVAAPFDLTVPTPGAGALLSLAEQTMNRLQSLREHNELTSGGPVVTTEFTYAAPDRMRAVIDAPSGRRETIAVGDRRFDREGDGPWQETPWPSGRYQWPRFAFTATATEVTVLGQETIDGVDCFVVALRDSAANARFRLWIGTEDHLIHRLVMMATGHYMTSVYRDFNAPLPIEAPE
ncbi:MAG: copper resistance protein CopC [Sphaerobacter sp.]|nr:copper resistance protein CopC [Sphaerobacter sp.]